VTVFFLVRHGSHDHLGRTLVGRMPGVSLNGQGRAEAERLAARLTRENVSALHASPQTRTRETAGPIAKALGIDCEIVADLDEIDFGAWTGRSFGSLSDEPAWRTWNTLRNVARPPGGETMLEAQARIVRHMEWTRTALPDSGVVLVGHGDMIKVAAAYYIGLALDFIHRLEADAGSLTTLVVGDWGARLLRMNEMPA
jgi:broad specificity phosphatase PhoE